VNRRENDASTIKNNKHNGNICST